MCGLAGNRYHNPLGARMDDPILDCLIIGGGPAGTDRRHLSRALPPRHPGRRRRQEPRRVDPVHAQSSPAFPTASRARNCCSGCASRRANMARRSRPSSSPSSSATSDTGLFTATWGSGCAIGADRASRDRSHQSPPADGRGSARRCACPRPHPLLPDLRRLRSDRQEGRRDRQRQPRRRRGPVHPQLHRRRHPHRARQGASTRSRTTGDKLEEAGIDCVDGPAQAVAILDRLHRRRYGRGPSAFDSIYPALGSDTHTQLAEMVGAELSQRSVHHGRRSPADQRSGPLCRRRRRHRPRPDQPCDGRRRRRRDDHPQRSCAKQPRWRDRLEELAGGGS